jgi:hypothetical protein
MDAGMFLFLLPLFAAFVVIMEDKRVCGEKQA